MKNLTDVVIPQADLEAIQTKLGELEALLKPYLVDLTPAERKRMVTINDGNFPFAEKAMQYTMSNTNLVPAFIEADAVKRDFDLYKQMRPMLQRIAQLHTNVENTVMESGHEAYSQLLSFYNAVKYADKMGVQGAKDIFNDLKIRFRN